MAHQIEKMAYVGETPWHGLGNQLAQNQPVEVWAKQAGMDWRIESSNVSYMAQNERGQSIIMPYEEQRVLYRSDTHAPLSVVSQRFQEVQPAEVLEFYRDLTEQSGFELETAGVLKGGKKFWALAPLPCVDRVPMQAWSKYRTVPNSMPTKSKINSVFQ